MSCRIFEVLIQPPQVGPRDLRKHSKWPYFMRLHGSVMPKMILPLIFVGAWSTLITCISTWIYDRMIPTLLNLKSGIQMLELISFCGLVGISSLLLTVLGFVVGLSLSFRSTTAYER